MNTLAWIASVPATFSLVVYSINTLDDLALGLGLLGVMFVELVYVWLSILDDVKVLWGSRD